MSDGNSTIFVTREGVTTVDSAASTAALLDRLRRLESDFAGYRDRDESVIASLSRRLADVETLRSSINHPLQHVFLAKRTGEKTWREMTVIDGETQDWEHARKCDNADDPAALVDAGSASFLCEIRDGDEYRYLEIGGSALVKVTGDASGGGKYTGLLWKPPAASVIPDSGNLTEAETGQGGDEVLILNAAEVGLGTHSLTSGTPRVKIFPAHRASTVSADDPPKRVYVITAFDLENCS